METFLVNENVSKPSIELKIYDFNCQWSFKWVVWVIWLSEDTLTELYPVELCQIINEMSFPDCCLSELCWLRWVSKSPNCGRASPITTKRLGIRVHVWTHFHSGGKITISQHSLKVFKNSASLDGRPHCRFRKNIPCSLVKNISFIYKYTQKN